jgi:hypothetical protein
MNHRNHRRIRTGTPTGNFAPDAKLRSSSSSTRYAIVPGLARSESRRPFGLAAFNRALPTRLSTIKAHIVGNCEARLPGLFACRREQKR